jgi:hypothetical protein
MKPPAEIPADDLWAQITTMPRAHRVAPFPRQGPSGAPICEIAIMVLSQEECMAAKASAERSVRKLLRDDGKAEAGQGYVDLSEMRDSQELLFRACKRTGDLKKPFFPTVEAVGKLTTDEIAVLVMMYRRVQAELGPIASEMSQDEVDAWIERLAQGGSLFPFDSLSSGAKSTLIVSMACRLWSFTKASSSPTPPPGEPT